MLFNHTFNGVSIPQMDEDTEIRHYRIPKGYVNGTALCKANGKLLATYTKSKSYNSFVAKFQRSIPIGIDVEIEITDGLNEERGTWLHPDIAIWLSFRIDDDFAVWAVKNLRLILNDEFEPLTEEAKKAKEELKKLWEKIRKSGKVTRRELTDSVKDWYGKNPGATSRPMPAMIAVSTNAIYQKLWGKDAVDLEEHLGCGRNQSRDYLDADSLKLLDRAEANVCDFIDNDNIKPIDAVAAANIRKAKKPPQRKVV